MPLSSLLGRRTCSAVSRKMSAWRVDSVSSLLNLVTSSRACSASSSVCDVYLCQQRVHALPTAPPVRSHSPGNSHNHSNHSNSPLRPFIPGQTC
jgi:hypothetical protein